MAKLKNLREKFENMTHQQKKAFIRSQKPKLVRATNNLACQVQEHGEERWFYRLACGWDFMTSPTSREAVLKYNNFMKRVK